MVQSVKQIERKGYWGEASATGKFRGLKIQNFDEEYPQIPEKARCRCNLYMPSRLKSICKSKEEQVADYNGPHSVDTPNRQLGHFLR
ncbi:hypothetical protein DW901_13055 [Firmicutes bacterium AM41-5BH]|nr:hypothetical protein DW901_13055 [Firmicutes bacterium AM41-5BH]